MRDNSHFCRVKLSPNAKTIISPGIKDINLCNLLEDIRVTSFTSSEFGPEQVVLVVVMNEIHTNT